MQNTEIELLNAQQTMALLGIKENAFNRFRKLNPDFPQPLPGLGKRLFLKSAVIAFINMKCGGRI
ncbi:hypothetical protein [uncultured Rheinheimera sp.]|uniref:helix-turn-helix transcriptional regulator n=1 Tax=uncultured Rheinheimera sp. TaxID=400532 RepID=UPI0025918B3F|nr:hypothetical protein [uncultured Rheinheimera sp.]